MIAVTDLKSGVVFQEKGNVWQVLSYTHTKMGRGNANIKVRAKNLRTGGIVEKSFMSGGRVEEITLEKRKARFLYREQESVTMMDPETYEQFTLPKSILGAGEKMLSAGVEVTVLVHGDVPVTIEWPNAIAVRVASADPGMKGDSVSNIMKGAIGENGMHLSVPLFIKEGDIIKVNPQTGAYAGRVKKEKEENRSR